MQKKYTIQLTEDEVETLLAGLRYLELHHPMEGKEDLKPAFKNLLNTIYYYLQQTELFP